MPLSLSHTHADQVQIQGILLASALPNDPAGSSALALDSGLTRHGHISQAHPHNHERQKQLAFDDDDSTRSLDPALLLICTCLSGPGSHSCLSLRVSSGTAWWALQQARVEMERLPWRWDPFAAVGPCLACDRSWLRPPARLAEKGGWRAGEGR